MGSTDSSQMQHSFAIDRSPVSAAVFSCKTKTSGVQHDKWHLGAPELAGPAFSTGGVNSGAGCTGCASCEVGPEQPTSSAKDRIEFRLIMAAPCLSRAYDQVPPPPSLDAPD
ncbi:MAG: hypothetical protein A2341_28100 [Deltaproteobacteria bacterium RIFOXYB12_FULL_58_9]|nr:MAG: hypothetical protein A2341_28100 [Deltaproteobacteria bacterium RIFOXYB12_FULL_58_9]